VTSLRNCWWKQCPSSSQTVKQQRQTNNYNNDNNTGIMASFHDNLGKLVPECQTIPDSAAARNARWWQWWQVELWDMQISSQITNTPTLCCFYRPDDLPVAQPMQSSHWRHTTDRTLCGLRVVRIDPPHFLVGCGKRRLNQALSVCLSLSVVFIVLFIGASFCVLLVWLFWLSRQYLPSDWPRKTSLRQPNRGSGIIST